MVTSHFPQSGVATISKEVEVQRNVQNDVFWDFCANFIHMVEAILVALRDNMGKT